MSTNNIVIIIPARLGSTRLERKVLLDIGKYKLIEHVYLRALKTGYKVCVATDSIEVLNVISSLSGKAVMTSQNCFSGTDRVHEAIQLLNDPNIEYVVNLQGDLPFINPIHVKNLVDILISSAADIATLATTVDKKVAEGQNNVKVVFNKNHYALYFSRNLIPANAKEYFYHIGVYGFKVKALDKFVKLPPSSLELSENLEQLRALESGMSIKVDIVDSAPISIDTMEDLILARSVVHEHTM
jgi:3-deoxy-manno-octulosonate cytidylyltransferase (CMP-KDO synthetase)